MANHGKQSDAGRETLVAAPLTAATNSSCGSSTESHADWIRATLDRFEGPLLRYALRITGELEAARDVVQETFLKLCKEDRAAIEQHLSQWLFTVCRNRALDVHRKERRMSPVMDLDQRSSPQVDTPQDVAELKETTSKVLSLLPQLPPNQQEVIRLKFQNELSYREISDVTGLSVTNVGFLLHVGLKRLRELLKTAGFREPVLS